jgi:hypothetical protein
MLRCVALVRMSFPVGRFLYCNEITVCENKLLNVAGLIEITEFEEECHRL